MMKDIQRPISRRKFLTIAGSALAALAGGCALSGTPAAVENAAKPLRKAVKPLQETPPLMQITSGRL